MDLSTTYLGLQLPHPFVAGASPLSDSVERVQALEQAGAALIVLRSLFEEQIDREALAHESATAQHAESHGEALSYLTEPAGVVFGPDQYLAHLEAVKGAIAIPVSASLNGHSPGGWLDYARRIEAAGADALELNLYDVITDPLRSSAEIEDELVGVVASVADAIKIPVAVKLSPFYTSLPNLAHRLHEAGASGLVLFNRFFDPDVDVEGLEVHTHMHTSTSQELLLRLRWLAILSGQIDVDLAATGGVHTTRDAVKAIMCGATVVQLVTLLTKGGLGKLAELRDAVTAWMLEHDYHSLAQMRGSMNVARTPDPTAYERANYVHMLQTWRFA